MQTQKKILVVDDNPANCAIIEELLGDQYNLMTVLTGQNALKAAQDFQPDLILLDVMMPGIDGYEVCRRIRMTPSLRYTRIIIVSAKAMVSERLKGYQAGADDYITKPFDVDELLAKIRVYLRLKFVEETEQIESNVLSGLYSRTSAPLNSLIQSAQTLMFEEELDTKERKALIEEVYLSAKELQNFFEENMPSDSRENQKVEVQAEANKYE